LREVLSPVKNRSSKIVAYVQYYIAACYEKLAMQKTSNMCRLKRLSFSHRQSLLHHRIRLKSFQTISLQNPLFLSVFLVEKGDKAVSNMQ
jgi:hypothetical protein